MHLILEDHTHAGVTIITLNRPEKRNALSIALMEELCQAIESTHRDPSQRVLILKGNGPSFCAGLDLTETNVEKAAEAVAKMLTTVYQSPLVTIAAVHGPAIAGGAGLMSACDIVLATTDARIGFPEVRRGLVAAQVMTLLIRQLSQRSIRELLLLGELVDAPRALEMGLINRIVATESLAEEVLALAYQALQGAPDAITLTKKLMDDLYPNSFVEDLNKAIKVHHESRNSSEAKKRIGNFFKE